MTDQSAATAAPAATADALPLLPLFYRALQPLNSQMHSGWRLKGGDASFAAKTPFVPIVVGELAAAARSYPVVFAADSAQPVVVLGLEKQNLFIDDGQWASDAYVPAYVRRYPFAFIATVNPEGFALAVDSGSERIADGGTEGAALFEEGKPSELTRQALGFCNAFQADAAATKAFTDALKAQDLLIDRRADATLPDGRKLGLEGFQVVDAEKFTKLPDAIILEWHNNGYLAWVYFHLASLDRFQTLLSRQAMRSGVTQPSSPPASDTGDAPLVDASPAPTKSKKA